MTKRVLLGQFMHETNTFCQRLTDEAAFRGFYCHEGEAVLAALADTGNEVAGVVDIARAEGLSVALRSRGEAPHGGVEVYVADTVGELGLFYRLAQVAFVGGTLVPVGGHNPIEPAKLGCALLHGPHVHNATEIFDAFDEGGGAREVIDAHELATGVRALLSDTAGTRQAARAAGHTAAEFGGALNRTLLAIEPMLLRASLDGREN